MVDFVEMLEEHLEKYWLYLSLFGAGFVLAFISYYLLQQYSLNSAIINSAYWAMTGIILSFIAVEGARHRNR